MPPKKKEGKKSKEDKEGKKTRSSRKIQELEVHETEERFPSTSLEASLEAGEEGMDEVQEKGFTDFDRERQITKYYEANPSLWDSCLEDYENKPKRQGVLMEFPESLGLTRVGDPVNKMWEKLLKLSICRQYIICALM